MIQTLSILSFLISTVAFGSPGSLETIVLPFQLASDTLCFQNTNPEGDEPRYNPIIRELGPRIFGRVGSKHGICQGIAGVESAFFEHATFVPDQAPKLSERQARRKVRSLVRLHKNNCPTSKKIVIPGYRDLRSFCEDYKNVIVDRATFYNFALLMTQIFEHLPQFLTKKTQPIDTARLQRQAGRTLESLHRNLREGGPALLLYYSHVVLVYGYTVVKNPAGVPTAVRLSIHDSNDGLKNLRPRSLSIALDPEGRVKKGEQIFWDITPNRNQSAQPSDCRT